MRRRLRIGKYSGSSLCMQAGGRPAWQESRQWAEQPSGARPVDVDGLGLADAVGARHGLQVVLGVPVGVEDDDSVSRGQVDAQAARTR